jgi:multidrug efflux system outer membrane protein
MKGKTLGIVCTLLAGCAVGPNYRPTTPNTARITELPSAAAQTSVQPGSPPSDWWTGFDDPVLNELLTRAWKSNFDVQEAAARYQVAVARIDEARSGFWPSVSTSDSVGRERLSQLSSPTLEPLIASPTVLSFGLNWELDLFGRIRRNIEAAHADAASLAAAQQDMRRLITAEVANAYFDLRESQQQVAALEQLQVIERRSASIVGVLSDAGRATKFDRLRVDGSLQETIAGIPPYLAQARAARDRLATLTAMPLDAALIVSLEQFRTLTVPAALVVDDPASLLRRRPDVRVAERDLAAATARIGVAAADLFPQVTLSGVIGWGALAPAQLFQSTSRMWGGNAALAWTPLDAGGLRARVREAGANATMVLAHYDKVVTTALEEADQALENYRQAQARFQASAAALTDSEQALTLAQELYRQGKVNLLELLEAQRSELQTKQSLIAAEHRVAYDIVAVYTAFAGGVDSPPSLLVRGDGTTGRSINGQRSGSPKSFQH